MQRGPLALYKSPIKHKYGELINKKGKETVCGQMHKEGHIVKKWMLIEVAGHFRGVLKPSYQS